MANINELPEKTDSSAVADAIVARLTAAVAQRWDAFQRAIDAQNEAWAAAGIVHPKRGDGDEVWDAFHRAMYDNPEAFFAHVACQSASTAYYTAKGALDDAKRVAALANGGVKTEAA